MTFRSILVDDEPLAVQRLARLLGTYADTIDIIDSAYHGREAVEKINRLNPDLVFLDIQMPELNGFDVLDEITRTPIVIFCTAYDEYALQAFETNSIDYLLKPVDPDRLHTAIEKLRRLTADDGNMVRNQLQHLLAELSTSAVKRIQVRVGDAIRFIALEDICYFRAEDKYLQVCTCDSSYLISKTLNELESELPARDFARIHRSAIINLNHLDKVVRWFGGRYRALMRNKDKTELEISRRYKHRLGI